jgi:hypothetical protein
MGVGLTEINTGPEGTTESKIHPDWGKSPKPKPDAK